MTRGVPHDERGAMHAGKKEKNRNERKRETESK